uniref:Cytochrome c heme attachment protein n=1 Tax=Selaginella nummulariifolia TaxID=1715387 RepID=A0A650FH09_9TRAC|nr:cytochrome c heme attachment protein [Selaginella nummulariifolia]
MSAHISPPPPFFVTRPYRGELVCEGNEELGDSGRRSVVIAPACVTGFPLNRRLYPGHPPSSDLYEPSTLPPRSPRLTHMVLIRGHNDWSGTTTAPGAMPTHGPATPSVSGEVQQSTVLVPAPQSHRSMTHASTMTPSHAAPSRGSLLAMAFLVIASGEHPDLLAHDPSTSIWSFITGGNDGRRSGEGSPNILLSLPMDHRERKSSQRSDHWSYRIISLGFLSSTLGIPPGAVRANEARGYHRNRDPKETRAPITRLTLAIHPHTRMTKGWQGGKPAIAAPPGSPITRIRHSGVDLSGRGLHSHGWLIR